MYTLSTYPVLNCVQTIIMALIDTKLRTIVNKSYTGSPELTDGDGLRVRITQKGTITFQFCYT